MDNQPEALRLADALKGQVQVNPRVGENDPDCGYVHELDKLIDEAADELRRLHAVNKELLEALRTALDASWNGPMPDYARDEARAAIAKAEEVKP